MTVMAQHFDIGCNQCGEWRKVQARTAQAARRTLKAQKWLTIRECGKVNDICPACSITIRNERLAIAAARQRARVAHTEPRNQA